MLSSASRLVRFAPVGAVVAVVAATTIAGAPSAVAAPSLPTAAGQSAAARTFVPSGQSAAGAATPPTGAPRGATLRTVSMPGGARLVVSATGTVTERNAAGRVVATRLLAPPARTPLGRAGLPDDVLRDLFSPAATRQPSTVVVQLDRGVRLTGPAIRVSGHSARRPTTSSAPLNAALHALGARSVVALPQAASATGDGTAVTVDVGAGDPDSAVRRLDATAGVTFAEVDRTVSSESTGGRPLPPAPAAAVRAARQASGAAPVAGALPTNYAVTDSLSAWLNANGVDAMGAYSTLTGSYGQLPGTGEIITNVSVGDLTDQAMADAGDPYVKYYGPTTVAHGGQRYLNLPSMPLIPTYVAGADGSLNPTGTTEGVDPTDSEIMLDFGVMAPLPHDQQRSGAVGTGDTDLLGIAPGADYRLVVPAQPTIDQVATAMLAAARQQPPPNVITASLGEGTDTVGFPGRYLEDDPVLESVIDTIVHRYGIVVTISANDGTRLFTPTAVNPDGGSTPTELTHQPGQATSVNDDALSTTPSRVPDSGAIDVGASTLDDVLSQPGQPTGTEVRTGTFAATRINGSTAYSSGFGSRVNVSAPGDGIAVFEHAVGGGPQSVTPVLSGGTSASAPMVAAAAAVVQQAARLAGQPLDPIGVRALLEHTGRTVTAPAQSDLPTAVGPQLDLSAAVRAVLPENGGPQPAIARVSVAHHVDLGDLEGSYSESTDPQRLDLTGDTGGKRGSGEGLLGPVTFGIDTVGISGAVTYELHVGDSTFRSATPAIRITPSQLLTAAGDPVVSSTDRDVAYTVDVRRGSHVVASSQRTITVGPTDGTYTVARAPVVQARASLGSPVEVSYDLTGVRDTLHPKLVVSTVGHWSPTAGPFSPAYSVDLTRTAGTLTLPASAFTGGGGLYGIGIAQQTDGPSTYNLYADMASILLLGPEQDRPAAPLLSTPGAAAGGHGITVTRARPDYELTYDVRSVPGASKAIYEISASGPTVFGALNTVTNAFGTQRDTDGVSTPSVAFVTTDAPYGTLHLSAATLPTDAVFYNVRVFAADAQGQPIGEASPTSGLEYDDGLPPNGGTVRSFDATAGNDSVAAVENPAGGQTLYHFDPATGQYGAVITQDSQPGDGYQVVGVDPSLHRVLLLHFDTGSQQTQVETWSTVGAGEIASTTVAVSDALILGGRVDASHHRALLLEHRGSDQADLVVPVDLTTGEPGAPVDADTGSTAPGSFYDLEIDPDTGDALLFEVTGGRHCLHFGSWPMARVDPASGTVTQSAGPSCLAAASPDASAGTLEGLTYRSFSVNFAGNTVLDTGPLGAGLGTVTGGGVVRAEPPSLLAVDGTRGVVAAGFGLPLSPPRFGSQFGYLIDSNATGQLAELDPATGATTKTLTGLEFGFASFGAYNGTTERRVQFDPASRTAWTFSSDGSQLQALSY